MVLAERAATLTSRTNVEALDVLAAAYASSGRFDAAVETATAALRLLLEMKPLKNANPLTDDVRERLDLYKQHVPFIVPD